MVTEKDVLQVIPVSTTAHIICSFHDNELSFRRLDSFSLSSFNN